eukprot:4775427-Alexandrium_andersonii.AAC.1
MSASLVGSEMCIRDRRKPICCTTAPPLNMWAPIERSNATPTLQRGLRTVSYTHLTLPTICSV